MKKSTYRVNAWARALVLTALSAFSIPAAAEVHTLVFTMDGAQEVPPNGSAGIGQCSVAVDDVARTVEVDCTYADLTSPATAAHIHLAPPGVSGPPILTLNHTGGTNGSVTGFGLLLPDQIQAMLDGNTYINLHSALFPDGEIRGQLNFDADPEPEAFVGGLLHAALGQASISGQDTDGDGGLDLITLSNISASGKDGVSIQLSNIPNSGTATPTFRVSGWSGEIDFGPIENLPPDYHVTVAAHDNEGNPIPGFVFTAGQVALAPPCINCTIQVMAFAGEAAVADLEYDGSMEVSGGFGLIGPRGAADGLVNVAPVSRGGGGAGGILVEKALRFSEPTSIIFTGQTEPVPDVTMLLVLITQDSASLDFVFEALRVTAANTGGNDITIQNEHFIVESLNSGEGDDRIEYLGRGMGQAHVLGTELCDDGGGGLPTTCIGAIEISNLGTTGDDGVTVRRRKGTPVNFNDEKETISGVTFRNDPILLDLNGDGVSIGSIWTSTEDGDQADFLTSWCRVLGTGGGGGAVNVSADFTDLDTNEICVEIWNNGARVGSACVDATAGVNVAPCPNQQPVRIVSLTDAHHAFGEHAAGFVVEFAEPVCIQMDQKLDPVIGGELRVGASDGAGKTKVYLKDYNWRTPMTGSSGGGSGLETIYITDIQPAAVSFTEGYAFGLHHTATNGATMSLGCGTDCTLPPGTGRLPLTVSGGGGGGGGGVIIQTGAADFLAVELGDERELTTGLDWGLRGTGYGQDPTGLIALFELQLNVEDAGKGDPNPPVIIGVDFAPSGASLQTITVHHEDGTVTEFRNLPNQTPITAAGATTDKAMPKLTQASTKGQGPEPGPEVGFGWDEPVEILVGGSFITDAGRFVLTSAQSPTINPPLAQVELEMLGGLREFTIADEALGVFDLDHRADGARFGCCADADGDGQFDLVMFNPLATGGAAVVSSKPKHIAVGTILSAAHTCEIIVPDPCAGKPEPCEVYPDGATLISQATFHTTTGGSSQNSSCWIHLAQPAASDCTKGPIGSMCEVTLTSDFTELGSGAITVEVLDGEVVAATVPFINSVPSIRILNSSCPDCGHNENWPFETEWETGTPRDGTYKVTARWVSAPNRSFTFEGGPTVEGDALRFTATSTVGDIEGIVSHELSTVNITEVIITDMQFEPTSTPCPADFTGDMVVNVADLLAVINNWGPCASPCPPNCAADITGDCAVNVNDLLAVINAWGACP